MLFNLIYLNESFPHNGATGGGTMTEMVLLFRPVYSHLKA